MTSRNIIGIIVFMIFPMLLSAQVTINNSGDPPDGSAMLDISSPDKGVLIPSMVIQSIDNAAPVEAPVADGLLIYNTGVGTDVDKGIYMWSEDDLEWVAVIMANNSIIQTMSSGSGGYLMQFGGKLDFDRIYVQFGGCALDPGENNSGNHTRGTIPRTGVIKSWAWSSQSGDATSIMELVIDLTTVYSLPLSGDYGVYDLPTPIAVTAGQIIEIRKTTTGTDPVAIGLMIYID